MGLSGSKILRTQLVLLAPSTLEDSGAFDNVLIDNRRHEELLADMQCFRGRIYLSDNAIRPDELTADGRHAMRIDDESWHILSIDGGGRVCACLRYHDESGAAGFEDLYLRHSTPARCAKLGSQFRTAVTREMERARRIGLGFGEMGGWAVGEERRLTLEPLRLVLATCALLQLLGGCAGVATASFRHHSSTILRRIGLTSLLLNGAALPPYYDPYYRCDMEVLRFDSRYPNPRYSDWIHSLRMSLPAAPVICRSAGQPAPGKVWVRETPRPVFPHGPELLPVAV